MALPLLIFLACFAGGAAASARWLPALPAGLVGGLAFFLVCGLLGAALGLAGLNLYTTIRQVESAGGRFGDEAYFLANGLRYVLFEPAVVGGLAGIVYLLACRRPAIRSDAS